VSLMATVGCGMPIGAQQSGVPLRRDTTRQTPPPVPTPSAPALASPGNTALQGPLTLDTAVAIALRVATPVQRARFASANAGTEVGRNAMNFLPTIGVAATRSVTAGNPLVGSRATVPWSTQFEAAGYQLSTSLNLLGALGAYPGYRAAEFTQQAYDLTLARTRQSVSLDVSQAFLQTVLDSELVVIADQNYRVSQEQVVQLQELVRVGKRPPADLYQAQAQASANQSIYFDAVNRQYADEIGLLQRLHIDPQRTIPLATPVLDTTRLAPGYLDTAAVAQQALARRPDLQSAKSSIDATRWGIRRAHNEDLPSLSIGFTLFSTGRYFDRAYQDGVNQILTPQEPLVTQVGNQATTIFSIGLGYNVLDLFRSHFDLQEAQVAYQSAEVAEGDVQRQVTGDIARAIGEYGVAAQRMTSTAAGLEAAQAAFQLVTGRYNVGFATIVDLLTAQAALAQAQSLRAQAIVQMSLSKRALAYAMGFQPTDRLP